MKVTVTQTGKVEIDDSIYEEWMKEVDHDKEWSDLTGVEKLKIVQECEKDAGYEIAGEVSNWNTEIKLA